MYINSRRVWIVTVLTGLSLSFVLFQNFSVSYLKPKDGAYVFDNFEDQKRSKLIWLLSGGSCNQVLHKDAADKYPDLGQTSRSGYCDFRYDENAANTFLRFITHPFDRRDGAKTPFEKSVDFGKGGSETRARSPFGYGVTSSGKSAKEGWDLEGDMYALPTNTLRYSFDFRIYNMSIFEEKLAESATISQFHQAANIGAKSCGAYYAGSAPSPALYFSLNKVNPSLVDFKLSMKLFEDKIRLSLAPFKLNCKLEAPLYGTVGATRNICEVVLWKQSIPKSEVLRKWYSVSFIMKSAQNGTLEFFFGAKDSNQRAYNYARKTFQDASLIAYVATTFNSCPAQIYLGNYVLGYAQLDASVTNAREPLYGLIKPDWLGLGAAATKDQMLKACDKKPAGAAKWVPDIHRLCRGEKWVAPKIAKKYGKFIKGTQSATETPPQLITDYDNFRIVQD